MTTEHNLNDVVAIHKAFIPSRTFRRAMRNNRCHLCGMGVVAMDLALVDIELRSGARESRIIHRQCSVLLHEMAEDLNAAAEAGELDDWAADPVDV